jgi:hypothetical protein
MVLKVQEVVYPVLEFREKNKTFTKVEGDNIDLFFEKLSPFINSLSNYKHHHVAIGTKHVYPEPYKQHS